MIRASASRWYRTRAVGDDVTLIFEPFIKEFYRCNIWHVRGRERDLLIDSGMGVVSLRKQVPLVTEKACLAVASHTHFDHIGSHHEFPDRLVHPSESGIMAEPSRASTLADPYVTDEIFEALPPEPFSSAEYRVSGAAATQLIEDGDVIDLGDRRFEVMHTPGHSPGGIALWEAATKILFSGDIVYDGPLIEDAYHSDPFDYRRSMRRIYDLPVRIVHGGHFPSFGGVRHREIVGSWLKKNEQEM
ncbi:MAG: MBL fold metallo-hydrolase [Albidovulum sp.]|nr:MBL fold metallo-hydrolase [Albidovulum sp.]